MPDQTKNHTTVVITVEMLDKLTPCPLGRANALDFLPAKFSTDPKKNLKLADKWAKTTRPWDLSWLMERLGANVEVPDYYEEVRLQYEDYEWSKDAWVLAQNMAALADFIATKEGR